MAKQRDEREQPDSRDPKKNDKAKKKHDPLPDDDDVLSAEEIEVADDTHERVSRGTDSDMPELKADQPLEAEEIVDITDREVLDEDLFAEEEVVEAELASDPGARKSRPFEPGEKKVLSEAVTEAGPPADAADDLDFFSSEGIAAEADAGETTELLEPGAFARAVKDEPTESHEIDADKSAARDIGEEDVLVEEHSALADAKESESGADLIAEEVESGVDLDGAAKKKVVSSSEDVNASAMTEWEDKIESEAAEALDSEEPVAAAEPPVGKTSELATMDLAEDEVPEFVDEDEPATKSAREAVAEEEDFEPVVESKKTAEEAEEEVEAEEEAEAEAVGAGGTAVLTKKPPRPKYLTRWIGGFFLAVSALVATAGGLWYFKPDLLEQALDLVPAPPGDSASVIGRVKSYKQAKNDLENERQMRARADKAAQEKESALAEAAKREKDLGQQVAKLKTSDKVASELRDTLVKAEFAPAKAELKDLPAVIKGVVEEKKKSDSLLASMGKTLENAKLLEGDKLDSESFDRAVKALSESRLTLEALNKKLQDAKVPAGDKGIAELIAARKQAEESLSALNKALADATVTAPGAKGVQELALARKKLEKERADLEQVVARTYKELTGKSALPSGDVKEAIAAAIKSLRGKSESPLAAPLSQLVSSLANIGTGTSRLIERIFNTASLVGEISYYRLREPFIVTPAAQLDNWLAVLQGGMQPDSKTLDAVMKEAAWLNSSEAKSTPEVKAKAIYATALALRDQGKYGEAKAALAKVMAAAPSLKNASWLAQAAKTQKELTDGAVYFLPMATSREEQGDLNGALSVINTGLKVIPGDARLLARRSLLRLEMSQPKPGGDVQAQIRQDAQAAVKDPGAASEAYFALGQLEEMLENWAQAEDDYRKAVKLSQGRPEETDRYRLALARFLLQHENPPVNTPAEPPAKEEKKDGKAALNSAQGTWSALFGLLLTGAQVPATDEENPSAAKRLKESEDLANDLIKSKNPKTRGEGYMLLGQVYARRGERTKGLQTYANGLQLVHPGIASKDLDKMIREHPAFQHPDTLAHPNPFLAEQEFGQGLHAYWSRQYAKAEKYFSAAIGFYNQDARYFYFLGLSRLHQPGTLKRDAAYFALEQGARLEAGQHPPAAEVDVSLERLQGGLRRFVDSFRQRALLQASGT